MRKKCLAIAKKAMVWTLAASMLVATPLTASAAGLRGVYSVSDGTDTWDKWGGDTSESKTGTVTTTNTDTSTLKDNDAKIVGIILDKDYVSAETDVKVPLKATILVEGVEDDSVKAALIEAVSKQLHWEVLKPDGTKADDKSLQEILSIKVDAKDRSVATLNPKKGTRKGEELIVKVSIDGNRVYKYAVKDENGNVVDERTYDTETNSYSAEAKVFIKEYAKHVIFTGPEVAYVKHTVPMMEYLDLGSDTVNDEITWSIETYTTDDDNGEVNKKPNKGIATISNAGVVSVKKAISNKTSWIKVTAVSEKGLKDSQTIKVDQGVKADRVEIYEGEKQLGVNPNKTRPIDLGGTKPEDKFNITAKMYVKSDNSYVEPEDKPITDVITWTSSKPAIAKVVGDGNDAVVTALAVGSAKITAKATNGKSANFTVKVSATLKGLTITGVPDKLYTGQSVTLGVKRDPEANKDGLTWKVLDKNPNAKITNKGVLTIQKELKAPNSNQNWKADEVCVQVSNKNNNNPISSEIVKISLTESSVSAITIEEVTPKKQVVAASERSVTKVTPTTLYASKSGTYKASVEDENAVAVSLAWKSSNPKVAEIVKTVSDDADGKTTTTTIKANAKGNATITVSGIQKKLKNATRGTYSYTTVKATFKIKVDQAATSIKLNKDLVVFGIDSSTPAKQASALNKDQKFTFKATFAPKNAKKETVNWSVVNKDGDIPAGVSVTGGRLVLSKGNYSIGDEYTVTASTASGLSTTATVKVVNKTAGLVISKEKTEFDPFELEGGRTPKKNTTQIGLAESIEIYPMVTYKKEDNKPVYVPAGEDNTEEDVTYSVNKKGIVKVTSDGEIVGLAPGTVKVTAKTASNKQATLTVVVVDVE